MSVEEPRGSDETQRKENQALSNTSKKKNSSEKVRRTLTPVGAAPQISDDLVDLVHLHAVEFHDGSEENKNKLKAVDRNVD